MATVPVPPDFVEFLRLLGEKKVRYLLVGGYAVNFHGYSRRTDDLDVWIAISEANAARIVKVLIDFGFRSGSVSPHLFLTRGNIVRMGRAPLQLEIINDISGVEFENCYAHRVVAEFGGVTVDVVDLDDLLANKRAAGRPKDLADVAAFASLKRTPPRRSRAKRGQPGAKRGPRGANASRQGQTRGGKGRPKP